MAPKNERGKQSSPAEQLVVQLPGVKEIASSLCHINGVPYNDCNRFNSKCFGSGRPLESSALGVDAFCPER